MLAKAFGSDKRHIVTNIAKGNSLHYYNGTVKGPF